MKTNDKITARLNQLAGVKEPEGRNAFKPLKDTLTFEKQRNKYVVFNYNVFSFAVRWGNRNTDFQTTYKLK